MKRTIAAVVFAACSLVSSASGQSIPQASPKEVWDTLANPVMDPDHSAPVQNVQIKRDRVTITLSDGVIQFAKPANGLVFGATFHGNGRVQMDPPNSVEEHQLLLFTKQSKLDLSFNEATFSFTDNFFDEVAALVKWDSSSLTSGELYAARQKEREHLGARHLPQLFKGLLSSDRRRTALFVADLHTKERDWIEVIEDATQHEELITGRRFLANDRRHFDVWTEFPLNNADQRHTYDDPAARQDFQIIKYQIDASVADNTDLNATATLTLQPRNSGERAFLFLLDSRLRVDSLKDAQGSPLFFVQSAPATEGPYVLVALTTASTDAAQQLQFHYAGRGVIRQGGPVDFYCQEPVWYPGIIEKDIPRQAFRSNFELTFHSPSKFQLFATGRKTHDGIENGKRLTTWVSDAPVSAAGFVFGDYLSRLQHADGVDLQIYVNRQDDNLLRSLTQGARDPLHDRDQRDVATGLTRAAPSVGISPSLADALSQLAPDTLAKSITVEVGNTVKVFQNYFGPYPYYQLTVTDAALQNQGLPGLLFLGWPNFLNPTQKAAIGINRTRDLPDFGDLLRGYENSRQWFGQSVGWKGYHDVWLSDGFAEFSANLYLQYREGPKEFLDRWRAVKQRLYRLDSHNRPIESLGPISLGWRLVSSESDPRAFLDLVSAKGAFVLHMLRMQLYDVRNADPDHLFKEVMQDYCKTFDNKPASTADFKAVVERHMIPSMDLAGTHTMDWFFDQYVYGTGIPRYTLKYTLENAADGKKHLKGTITRSGVPDSWKDDLVLYGHSGGNSMRLGIIGATHPEQNLDAMLPGKIDKISINDQEDTLAEVTQ
jgi:hypothetical protein